jgi:7-cyano-7-deazaguanine synthase
MEKTEKVIVLVSGGMDSVTALYDSDKKYQIIAGVSFDYGAKHNAREIPFAQYHCRRLGIRHEVISLKFMNTLFKSDLLKSGGEIPDGHYEDVTMKQTVVPFRNGVMMAIVAGFAESEGANGLVIASHLGDHAIYPDCREDFMKAMGEAIRLGTYIQVKVILPFLAMNKSAIAKCGHKLGIDFSKTWSCYKGLDVHCGKCGTCVERREAFVLAGINDPTVYQETCSLPPKRE